MLSRTDESPSRLNHENQVDFRLANEGGVVLKLNIKLLFLLAAFMAFGVAILIASNSDIKASLQVIAEKRTIFADIWTITYGAETHAKGGDPMVHNPYDPMGRALNYPRVWQLLYLFGIDKHSTVPIGLSVVGLYLLSMSFLLPAKNDKRTLLLIFATISPAILLAVKRANIDLVIFFLVTTAMINLKRRNKISLVIILISFILKLFPVFASISLLLRRATGLWRQIIVISAVVLFYVFMTRQDILLIVKNTPKECGWSYGLDVLWMNIAQLSPEWGCIFKILSYIVFALIIGMVMPSLIKDDDAAETDDDIGIGAFRAGGSIFVGTFVLASNFDYRLVFLLLAIPQLSNWLSCKNCHIQKVARATLLAIFTSLWFPIVERSAKLFPCDEHYIYAISEISNWLLLYGLMYLIAWSTPQWCKSMIRRVFALRRVDLTAI